MKRRHQNGRQRNLRPQVGRRRTRQRQEWAGRPRINHSVLHQFGKVTIFNRARRNAIPCVNRRNRVRRPNCVGERPAHGCDKNLLNLWRHSSPISAQPSDGALVIIPATGYHLFTAIMDSQKNLNN